MVELKEITKIYKGGGITPFSRLSLTVMSKELVVITGPRDCGKSTILRLIAGFEDLSYGEIRIDDDSMNKTPAADRYVSLVPQDYRDDEGGGLFGSKSKARLNRGALARDVKVYDNMAFDLQNKKVPKNVIDRRIDQTLKALACEKFLDNYVKALNSAQCWRVAFGRAIVRNPKVYLFDDPFSGIEKNNQATLAEELLAIFRDFVWKDYNAYASIIFAAREPGEELTKLADRVIVMNKDGTIQN
jgi:multiple sugar transport system ATP-binding protein